jgi:hypothetical protein
MIVTFSAPREQMRYCAAFADLAHTQAGPRQRSKSFVVGWRPGNAAHFFAFLSVIRFVDTPSL